MRYALNRKRSVGVVAALVVAVGFAAASPVRAEDPTGPTIEVSPSTGLRSGDMVVVHGSGFQPYEQTTLMMFTGFIGGYAPDTAIPVTADEFGNFTYDAWDGYPVTRLINAKIGPFVDEYAWTDCAATDPFGSNACYLGTFGSGPGDWSFAETPLQFEQTWVEVDASTKGTVSRAGGTASVTGEVTCPDLPYPSPSGVESAMVSGTLYQRIGRKAVATGTFTTEAISCTGEPVRWTATVYPTGGVPFGSGGAELTATAKIVTLGSWIPSDSSTAITRLEFEKPSRR